MAHDSSEFEELFRPQIQGRSRHGYRFDGQPGARSPLAQLRTAAKRHAARLSGKGRTPYDLGETPSNSRRCLVKAHYVAMARGGRVAAARHLAYLERDGVERDGSPGQLYGAEETFDREGFGEALEGEKRQFRFIVSPEDARDIDLRAFARDLVAQMEKDLGRPLIWAAVNHHNTEHPHVHLVVRGVDANGKELRIPPRYISQDLRARAQNILTRELGLRSEVDISEQRRQEVGQERLTSIDRIIGSLLGPEGVLDARAIAANSAPPNQRRLHRLPFQSPGATMLSHVR